MAKKTQYAITQKEMAKLLSDHMNAKLGSYAHTTGDLILAAYRIGISKAALVCDGRAESHYDPVCINEGRKCAAAIRHFCDPANSETSNALGQAKAKPSERTPGWAETDGGDDGNMG